MDLTELLSCPVWRSRLDAHTINVWGQGTTYILQWRQTYPETDATTIIKTTSWEDYVRIVRYVLDKRQEARVTVTRKPVQSAPQSANLSPPGRVADGSGWLGKG